MRLGLSPLGFGGAKGAPSVSYSTEATAYFAAMATEPDADQKSKLDDFISGLVSEGWWAILDAIWIYRGHANADSLLNVKDPASFTSSLVNAPTFTANRGFTGNGTSSYINTNFNPATAGGNYTQNSACFGVYLTPGVGTETGLTNGVAMGTTLSTGLGDSVIQPRNGSNAYGVRVNNTTVQTAFTSTSRSGLWVARRKAASGTDALSLWKNGASVLSTTTSSAAVASNTFKVLSTGATAWLNNQAGLAFAGGAPSDAQIVALDTLWDAYVAATT